MSVPAQRGEMFTDEPDPLLNHRYQLGYEQMSPAQMAAIYAALLVAYRSQGEDWSEVARGYGVSYDDLCELLNMAREYFPGHME